MLRTFEWGRLIPLCGYRIFHNYLLVRIIRIYNHSMSNRSFHSAPKQPHDTSPVTQANTARASQADVKRISSHVILAGDSEIEIDHNGSIYRLRQTSLGKLILTK